jgi:hypothetical protein
MLKASQNNHDGADPPPSPAATGAAKTAHSPSTTLYHHPYTVAAASTERPRISQKSWPIDLLPVRLLGRLRGRQMRSNHLQIYPPAAGYLSTAFVMACLPPLLDQMVSNAGCLPCLRRCCSGSGPPHQSPTQETIERTKRTTQL